MFYDTKGQFVGVRRPGSKNPIEVSFVLLEKNPIEVSLYYLGKTPLRTRLEKNLVSLYYLRKTRLGESVLFQNFQYGNGCRLLCVTTQAEPISEVSVHRNRCRVLCDTQTNKFVGVQV